MLLKLSSGESSTRYSVVIVSLFTHSGRADITNTDALLIWSSAGSKVAKLAFVLVIFFASLRNNGPPEVEEPPVAEIL